MNNHEAIVEMLLEEGANMQATDEVNLAYVRNVSFPAVTKKLTVLCLGRWDSTNLGGGTRLLRDCQHASGKGR